MSGAGLDSQVGEWSASLSTLLNLDLLVDGLDISFSYKSANINMSKKYIKPYSLGNGVCVEEAVTYEAPMGVTG